MSTTPNYGWNVGNEYDDNWWAMWLALFTAIDAAVYALQIGTQAFTNDIKMSTAGKGLVCTTPDGAHTVRIAVSNADSGGVFSITTEQLT